MSREQLLDSYRAPPAVAGAPRPEAALVAQFKETLAGKDIELRTARTEVAELRTKLSESKLRAKKLTELLMEGEMKDKTEVMVQVHKLEKVRQKHELKALSSGVTFLTSV